MPVQSQALYNKTGCPTTSPTCVNEDVGEVLADANGVQGVGHLRHAKLTRGLLRVPLGAWRGGRGGGGGARKRVCRQRSEEAEDLTCSTVEPQGLITP